MDTQGNTPRILCTSDVCTPMISIVRLAMLFMRLMSMGIPHDRYSFCGYHSHGSILAIQASLHNR